MRKSNASKIKWTKPTVSYQFRAIILLIAVLVLFNGQMATMASGNDVMTESAPSALASTQETTQLEEFSITALSSTTVRARWEITGEYYSVKIYRRFLDVVSLIGIVGNLTTYFDDAQADYGTYYEYFIRVFDEVDVQIIESESKAITTPVTASDPGAPQYSWEGYKRRKFPPFQEPRWLMYLNYTIGEYDVYNYSMHGVRVIVAIDKNVSSFSSYEKARFAINEFRYFNRLWCKFRAFPLNEYRIVVEVGGILRFENELGLLYPPSEIAHQLTGLGEKQSHEIGHAWFNGIIKVERNTGGPTFDPITEDSDKWISEGFDRLYGILAVNLSSALSLLRGDLAYYENMTASKIDMPLVDLPVYFGTKEAHTYYAKGALFALHIHRILSQNASQSLNQFMRHLYRKYNLTIWKATEADLLSTEELLTELNAFSGLDFAEAFDQYVYGTEEIPISEISEAEVQSLMETNEDPTAIDMIPPIITLHSPVSGTTVSQPNVTLSWSIDDHSEIQWIKIRQNQGNWTTLNGSARSYTLTNLSIGENIILLVAGDSSNTTATLTIVLEYQIPSSSQEEEAGNSTAVLGSFAALITMVLLGKHRKRK
ncbi:MAG: hypothetical protein ACFFGZ_10980 [Candidatus Thorarchaeota archaeon]